MRIRIAHISDLHFNAVDAHARDELTKCLRDIRPDFLVISGDICDNPKPGLFRIAAEWIGDSLRASCSIPSSNVIITPGNHDVRAFGNVAIPFWAPRLFRKAFKDWNGSRPAVYLFKKENVSFFVFDSNCPLVPLARGYVPWLQRKRWKSSFDRHRDRALIDRSFKVAIVHHHPLPVPYSSGEFFERLVGADAFIKALAEWGIDMVLHGHKHLAAFSHLSLGTTFEASRTLFVLGAGAAILQPGPTRSIDPRGHTLNLIELENGIPVGLSRYFSEPRSPFYAEPIRSAWPAIRNHAFEQAIRKANCRFDSKEIETTIDENGDALNRVIFRGLSVVRPALPYLEMTASTDTGGHLGNIVLDAAESDSRVSLGNIQKARGEAKFHVVFREKITPETPPISQFVIKYYEWNAYPLTAEQYRRRFPKSQHMVCWNNFPTRYPTALCSAQINFHTTRQGEHLPHLQEPPSLEVFNKDDLPLHYLQQQSRHCLVYSQESHNVHLTLEQPIQSVTYRITWRLRGMPSAALETADLVRVKRVRKALLDVRREYERRGDAGSRIFRLQQVMGQLVATVREYITDKLTDEVTPSAVQADPLDASWMVYDEAADPVVLRVVCGTGIDRLGYWDFAPEVGDGIGGLAFKLNKAAQFNLETANQNPLLDRYLRADGEPAHEILVAAPLADWARRDLLIGVVSIGSFEKNSPLKQLLLQSDQHRSKFAEHVEKFSLQKLREFSNV